MRHYCTLFDSKYAPQGLALYESLLRHSSEPFTLHVLALDAECFSTLSALELLHIKVIDLESFEQLMFLETVRKSRTWQEYAWTLASVFTESLLNDGRAVIEVTHSKSSKREFLNGWVGDSIDSINYCDADVYFFSDPEVIFDRIGDRSIGITPHYFPDKYKYLERNGKYCVSIVHFKNTEVGRKCLSRWASDCRAWCKYENAGAGKFADQGYLDEWPALYGDEVCELPRDVAWAPWNLSDYDGRPLRAFHFHEFKQREDGTFQLTNYPVNTKAFMDIYSPYIYAVTAAKERIAGVLSAR